MQHQALHDRPQGVEVSRCPAAELSRDALVDLLGPGDGLCLDLGCGTGLYGTIIESTGRAGGRCRCLP